MEAPVTVRIFHPCVLNRCLFSKKPPHLLLPSHPKLSRSTIFQQSSTSCPTFYRKGFVSEISLSYNTYHPSFSPVSSLDFNPFNFRFSLPSLQSRIPPNHFDSFLSSPNGNAWAWNRGSESAINGNVGCFAGEECATTVVLLGWLGAKYKHLRRYVEWYNARGIHALTFLVDPRDLLWSISGRRVEKRISALAEELISWLSDKTENDKERRLIFHTFSNTGWFVYGAILEVLQSRKDLLEKIMGCVVDSGGGDPFNPQVWAAGFSAAILKKHSSSAYAMVDGNDMKETEKEVTVPKIAAKEPLVLETFLLSAMEKFFSVALKFPEIDQRLKKVVSILTENQPLYPELYLYSSADKVMPFKSVELLIEKRKKMGRKVFSYNFGSSPHVDHYRTYPDVYSSQLHKFLIESLSA